MRDYRYAYNAALRDAKSLAEKLSGHNTPGAVVPLTPAEMKILVEGKDFYIIPLPDRIILED